MITCLLESASWSEESFKACRTSQDKLHVFSYRASVEKMPNISVKSRECIPQEWHSYFLFHSHWRMIVPWQWVDSSGKYLKLRFSTERVSLAKRKWKITVFKMDHSYTSLNKNHMANGKMLCLMGVPAYLRFEIER